MTNSDNSPSTTPAAKCAFAVYGEYQDISVLDLSGIVPYRVHLSTRQSAPEPARHEESTSTSNNKTGQPLTILVAGSCLDLRHALRTGAVELVDSTSLRAKKTVRIPDSEDQDVLEHFPCSVDNDACEPWVLVQDSAPLSQPQDEPRHDLDAITTASTETTLSASSLVTIPAPETPEDVGKILTMTWDLTDTLRPLVRPGRTYRLQISTAQTGMGVLWWGWGDREEILRGIEKSRDSSSGDPQQQSFSLADLQSLSKPHPETDISFRYVHRGAARFRVVERVPVPPVLQVRLSLVRICEADGAEGTTKDGHVEGEVEDMPGRQERYSLRVTTTYPRISPKESTSATPSATLSTDRPITVQLYGPQEHLLLQNPSRVRLHPRCISPDISHPIFARNPDLSNFRIVDTLTGEDLVEQSTKTHPQIHRVTADETMFLTLHPGDSVTRDVKLPYPSVRKRPQPGDPGCHRPRVREMEAGKEYRISLRGLHQGMNSDGDGAEGSRDEDFVVHGVRTVRKMGKGFWWREGTMAELFAGIDEVPSEEEAGEAGAQKERERQSKLRRRVFGTRGLPLQIESQDVVYVTCRNR